MKHMQIRKPMLKASFVDPSLSEEEVNMKFVQDLLNWVEEMRVRMLCGDFFCCFYVFVISDGGGNKMFLYAFKVQLDQGEWGSDLPSVESHLENHRNVHKATEDFQMSINEAKMSEVSIDSGVLLC